MALSRHAGRQTGGWAFSFKTLYAKLGSSQRFSDFARDLRRIAANNHQPEYHLTIYDDARGDPCLHAVRRTLLAPGHQTHHPELLQDLGNAGRGPGPSPAIPAVPGIRCAVKLSAKSVVREIRKLRSVAAGGGQLPPATRWGAG